MDISPWTNSDKPTHNTVFSILRNFNPKIKIYLYNTCAPLSQNLGPAPTSFVREAWLLATSPTDLRTYGLNGLGYPGNSVSNPDSSLVGVNFDVSRAGPAAYANIWKKYGGLGDGYWFDYFQCIISALNVGQGIDITKPAPGYGSSGAMDTAFTTAWDAFTSAMLLDGKPKITNSGGNGYCPLSIVQKCQGELLELWDQFAGYITMDAAMTRALLWQGSSPTGDGTAFLASYTLNAFTQGDSGFWAFARFPLGCACVAGGYSYCGHSGHLDASDQDMNIWLDEYTVDANGVSDGSGYTVTNRGWLGRPIAYGFKHASGCYVREFQNGIVIVNGTGAGVNHPLTGTWKRIRGAFDTVVNNGATVSGTVNVPNKDARFLLRV
jgi:hypothetical protein